MNKQITSFMLQGSALQGYVWLGRVRFGLAKSGMVWYGVARHGSYI